MDTFTHPAPTPPVLDCLLDTFSWMSYRNYSQIHSLSTLVTSFIVVLTSNFHLLSLRWQWQPYPNRFPHGKSYFLKSILHAARCRFRASCSAQPVLSFWSWSPWQHRKQRFLSTTTCLFLTSSATSHFAIHPRTFQTTCFLEISCSFFPYVFLFMLLSLSEIS